jgi:hypothetical protein
MATVSVTGCELTGLHREQDDRHQQVATERVHPDQPTSGPRRADGSTRPTSRRSTIAIA